MKYIKKFENIDLNEWDYEEYDFIGEFINDMDNLKSEDNYRDVVLCKNVSNSDMAFINSRFNFYKNVLSPRTYYIFFRKRRDGRYYGTYSDGVDSRYNYPDYYYDFSKNLKISR